MSFQWTMVATFLYVEVAFLILLLLPLISPPRWQKIFKSRLANAIRSYASLYFNIILFILVLLLADAIREMIKYNATTNLNKETGTSHYGATMEIVKELRAQRNFHISGTALFLWFVIKRLLALISNAARLMADNEAVQKQAKSATFAATELLKQSSKDSTAEKARDDIVKSFEEKITKLKDELIKSNLDLDTMKTQAENVSKEYDNLLREHAKVQAKLERLENSSESKKTS